MYSTSEKAVTAVPVDSMELMSARAGTKLMEPIMLPNTF